MSRAGASLFYGISAKRTAAVRERNKPSPPEHRLVLFAGNPNHLFYSLGAFALVFGANVTGVS